MFSFAFTSYVSFRSAFVVHRYEPPESEITTPLRRSDWAVPHGSAMQALASALSEAAGSTAVSL